MWALLSSWCGRWRNRGTDCEQLSNITYITHGRVQTRTQSLLSPKPPAPGSLAVSHLWEELQQQVGRGQGVGWPELHPPPSTSQLINLAGTVLPSFPGKTHCKENMPASKLVQLHCPWSFWAACKLSQDKESWSGRCPMSTQRSSIA